jgi:hypothetical protein
MAWKVAVTTPRFAAAGYGVYRGGDATCQAETTQSMNERNTDD